MSVTVACFCGRTYTAQDMLHGTCPSCATPLPGDRVPDVLPDDWNSD